MKLTGNEKSKLNLIVDIVMFLFLSAMAGIGFLMKYVVVSGEIRNVKYGNHVDLEFLSLTRHQWGSIHLIISIIFLVLLVLHIILHWKCIIRVFKCMLPAASLRYAVAGFIGLFSLITLISPFILEPQKIPFEPQYRNRNIAPASGNKLLRGRTKEVVSIEKFVEAEKDNSPSEIQEKQGVSTHKKHHYSTYDDYEVYGYNTLQYVADRYNVPAAVICHDLSIPDNLTGEKIGLLRRRYAFSMNDIKRSIYNYRKQND